MATFFLRKKLFNNQLRQLHRSTVALSIPTDNIFKDKKELQDVKPMIINSILTSSKLAELPEVRSWIKNLFDYTLEGGKLSRGLCVGFAYRMLEKPENITEEVLHTTRVLGWCLEMAYYLVVDDIIDGSTTRRGKPCWYLQPNIGSAAINDTIFMYQFLMEVVQQKFWNTPIYADVIRIINEAVLYITIGQNLDFFTLYNKEKNNIDVFTMDRLNILAIHKASNFSFNTPINLALLLLKSGNERYTQKGEFNHICLELGKLIQFENDYKDVFVDETITGKAGSDIQEGKLTWVAVTALERCNESQRSIFKEYYGSKDPEHVKQIKQIYDELQLRQVYEHYLSNVNDDLMRRIQALPTEGERKLFLELLNACYKQIY